jgi:hypothetical protein
MLRNNGSRGTISHEYQSRRGTGAKENRQLQVLCTLRLRHNLGLPPEGIVGTLVWVRGLGPSGNSPESTILQVRGRSDPH